MWKLSLELNLGGSGATSVVAGKTYTSVSLYLIVLWVSMRLLDLISYKILNTEKLILHTLKLMETRKKKQKKEKGERDKRKEPVGMTLQPLSMCLLSPL